MGQVTTAFVQQYKNLIVQLVQQRVSKLRPAVMIDTDFVGEYKFYDQLGSTEMQEKVSRHQDTPIIDPDHERRRVSKVDYLHNTLLDLEDQLNMVVDPKGPYARSASMAAGRQIDDIIIAALGGTAYSGKTGSTSSTLASANKVAVNYGGTNVGLTKAKLIKAKEIMDIFDVEDEGRYLALYPTQLSDLLDTTEATSTDYNTVKALVDGEMDTWLGFKFIKTTRLVTDTSGYRQIYAFSKEGLQLAIQKEPMVRMDQRKDKNYAWQVFMSMSMGAVRMEEERVVQITCDES